ncbi:MAG: 2'-5' RNA ligase family protein [Acidimicrobiales bacterium]|jgi:hypothetical protein
MPTEESALVVLVPESEHLVEGWRRQYDQAATYGVPAHVTVLYPFVPPRLIDDALKAQLRILFESFGAFDFSLRETRRFDDRILYLVPSPAEPFERLTRAVFGLFPEYPPYEGRFEQVLAHLTVADEATPEHLDLIETAIRPGLPLDASARSVSLLVGRDEPNTWHIDEEFSLSAQSSRATSP